MDLVRIGVVMLALVAFSGCLGAEEATVDDVDLPPVTAGMVDVAHLDGVLEVAVATPLLSLNQPGGSDGGWSFEDLLRPTENTTGYVLELVWDAAYPTNERLSLWIRADAALDVVEGAQDLERAGPLLRADGGSVLRLVVAVEDLPDPEGSYSVLVRAADEAGVALEQPFELHVSTFVGKDLDADFSALDG